MSRIRHKPASFSKLIFVMTLTAPQLKAARKLFDRFDVDRSGCLTYDEFTGFIKTSLAAPLDQYGGDEPLPQDMKMLDIPEPEIEWLLNGIDIDNSKSISFSEVIKCFAAITQQDILQLSMMSYRGLDKMRKRLISFDDIPEFVGIYGAKVPRDKFLEKCDELLGRHTGTLTFSEWHKVISGVAPPSDFDPYEGQIPKKGCCLLI